METLQKPCSRANILGNNKNILRMFIRVKETDYEMDFAYNIYGTPLSQSTVYLNRMKTRENAISHLVSSFPIFSDKLRSNLLNGVIQSFKSYFPNDRILSNFNLLDPANLPIPNNPENIQSYVNNIKDLNSIFARLNLEELNLVSEFKALLLTINNDRCFLTAAQSELDPVLFWKKMLDKYKKNAGLNILKLIHTVLSIPVNSADAERTFSILNHVRTKRSSRLTVENLEAKLR